MKSVPLKDNLNASTHRQHFKKEQFLQVEMLSIDVFYRLEDFDKTLKIIFKRLMSGLLSHLRTICQQVVEFSDSLGLCKDHKS